MVNHGVTPITECTQISTRGSNVWLDDPGGMYLRLPIGGIGTRPEWLHEAGPLQDNIWHPMISWRLGQHPLVPEPHPNGLMIDYPENGQIKTAWFPQATIERHPDGLRRTNI